MEFENWLDVFVTEKGLDLEESFTVQGPSGDNFMPLECVIEAIKQAPPGEQAAIKDMLVRIDYANADLMRYFRHLAQAIAC